MIQACIIFYNDGPRLLERCLKSLKGKVDKIVCIDGPFKDFQHNGVSSHPSCLEVVYKYASKVIPGQVWESQIQKRNAYLTLENLNDYYFIIDADEFLSGIFPHSFDSAYNAIPVRQIQYPKIDNWQIRIIRHKPGLKYRHRHAWIYDGEKIINWPEFNSNYKNYMRASITHTPELRGEKRLTKDAEYMKSRREMAEPPAANPRQMDDTVLLMFHGKHFCGNDGPRNIEVKRGDKVRLTVETAHSILNDYPNEWSEVK